MIYDTKRTNFKKFNVFQENKLPPRGYFIPFPTAEEAARTTILSRRYKSPCVTVLNGEWDFAYFRKHSYLPKKLDTSKVQFDKIPVPSCWQFLGYEPPFYTNTNYPFPPNPPRIPISSPAGKYRDAIDGSKYATGSFQFNSVGAYRKYFRLSNLNNKHFVISFLGVAGAFELYLNGKYVGYSEGSHNTAEFDLDSFVQEGENELVLILHKWSTASYLEDQDMFRNNGIFRDVLLFVNKKTYVWDFDFFTIKNGACYDSIVKVMVVEPDEETSVTVTLADNGKVIAMKTAPSQAEVSFTFEKLSVTEWNAELPKLYELTITLRKNGGAYECIKKNVGFATAEVRNRTYLFNGKKIKMHGVNHHDTNPDKGYVLSPEELEYDVRIFKEYNINTVRTSHYPPDPMFIELCDYYGIYVVDEADIETHGLHYHNPKQISAKKKWREVYWDRVSRMYYRDRNSCSIAMWSLGNESGGIKCQDYCYDKLKALTPIPVHYEGICNYRRMGYDVISQMYTSVDKLEKLLTNTALVIPGQQKALQEKPYFLCEYAHAMGVGPGSLEEYWKVIYSHDNAMGGCIWEFCDHAIRHKNGKYEYTYGGDHGEYTHDSNFCVDGLFLPDRKPSTGAFAVKNVYRPVRAILLDKNGKIEFKNYQNFRTADYITVKGAIIEDGAKKLTFEVKLAAAAGESDIFNLHLEEQTRDAFINLDYYDGERVIATEQLTLNEALPIVAPTRVSSKLFAHETPGSLTVELQDGFVKFSKEHCSLNAYRVANVDYLSYIPAKNGSKGSLYADIYRAPTDNDMHLKCVWKRAGYDKLTHKAQSFSYFVGEESVTVNTINILTDKRGKGLFEVKDTFEVFSNGELKIATSLTPLRRKLPNLPRIGKVCVLNREFSDIIYYGRGDKECYPDFKEQSRIGVYRSDAAHFMFPYIYPQESGNRTDVRYGVFRNAEGAGVMFVAETNTFNLGAKVVSETALEAANHREDIVDEGVIYVNIDGFMAGVGSNSCGPLPMEKYRLSADKIYNYGFRIIPFTDIKDADIIY